MEDKKDVYKNILENIGKIYGHEKKINEKIIEIQRTNANLLRNQRDLAKIVISIDKQQQRIINQMNFIANRLDKLDKDTDMMKEEQLKMNEKLLQNSAAEQQNATIFRNIQEEIGLGNRTNYDKMEKIRETVAEITKYFLKFNSTLESANRLAVDFLGDIRKELSVSKKASIIIREASPKLLNKIKSDGLASKTIHIPKVASVNEQIKGVIQKEIRTNEAEKERERTNQLKDAKKVSSKQTIGLPKGSAIEKPIKGSKENIKDTAKDAAKKERSKEQIQEEKVQKELDRPKEPTKKEVESNDRKQPAKDAHPVDELKTANVPLVSPVKSVDDTAANLLVKESKTEGAVEADLAKSKTESKSLTELKPLSEPKLPNDLKTVSAEEKKNAADLPTIKTESKPPNEVKIPNEPNPATKSKSPNESKSVNELKTAPEEGKKDAKGSKDASPTNKQVAMLIVADNSDSTNKVVVTSLHESLLDLTKGKESRDGTPKDALPKEPSNLNLPVIANEPLPRQVNLSNLVVGPVCDLPTKEVKSEAKAETKSAIKCETKSEIKNDAKGETKSSETAKGQPTNSNKSK